MRWRTWWQILIALYATSAQSITPTVCEDESCRCDSFTRVICNCTKDYDEVTLRPNGAYRVPDSATAILIDGCARVFLLTDTVRHLVQLRNVELRNVRHVYIGERALAWSPFPRESEMNPGINIIIYNSTVNEIASHAVQGQVNDILISKSRINVIKPFAFSSLTGVKSVELTDNVFDNIDIQTFKKFTTANFLFRGNRANKLPSRFLSDVEVTDLFRMDAVRVNYVYSLSFLVNSPKRVIIENNDFGVLEGDCFHITTRGPITFKNNTVGVIRKGAFLGFSAEREVTSVLGLQELLIDNNTVTELSPFSFMYNQTSLTLRVDGLNLNTSCTCELAEVWSGASKEQFGIISCWYVLEGHYITLPTFVGSRCGTFKQYFWIYILIGVLIVVLVAVIVVFLIVRRENEKKRKLQMVMPDVKTYRETEFHIVLERAELITTDL